VFNAAGDPVKLGLVVSLARPGGNATGPSLMAVDLSGKRLELLKEAVPNLSRVALLSDPTTASSKERVIKANQAAANALGISLWPAEITAPDQIEPVFSKITRPPIDHVHGPLHGLDVEPVQKLLERLISKRLVVQVPFDSVVIDKELYRSSSVQL